MTDQTGAHPFFLAKRNNETAVVGNDNDAMHLICSIVIVKLSRAGGLERSKR